MPDRSLPDKVGVTHIEKYFRSRVNKIVKGSQARPHTVFLLPSVYESVGTIVLYLQVLCFLSKCLHKLNLIRASEMRLEERVVISLVGWHDGIGFGPSLLGFP
jgi:hypothetical protein